MNIRVVNRSDSVVIYNIPELGVRREFMPREVKMIPREEINALSYRPGGTYLLQNNLFIEEAEVLKDMPINVEPEYYLTEEQIINLLNNGTLDELLDCLDFAPKGVLDLIKKYAYELPVNDSRKRKAIKEKLDFDVDLALLHKEQVEEEEREDTDVLDSGMKDLTPQRRIQPTGTAKKVSTENSSSNKTRRTAPKYKIVSQEG